MIEDYLMKLRHKYLLSRSQAPFLRPFILIIHYCSKNTNFCAFLARQSKGYFLYQMAFDLWFTHFEPFKVILLSCFVSNHNNACKKLWRSNSCKTCLRYSKKILLQIQTSGYKDNSTFWSALPFISKYICICWSIFGAGNVK